VELHLQLAARAAINLPPAAPVFSIIVSYLHRSLQWQRVAERGQHGTLCGAGRWGSGIAMRHAASTAAIPSVNPDSEFLSENGKQAR
jgi:hypothetical protein